MKTLIVVMIIAMTATPILTGCKSADALNATYWKLTSLNGQALVPGTRITINFEGHQITGDDGCNSYRTTYALDGSSISINESIISSMIACSQPVMQQASDYLAVLIKAVSYRSDEQQLLLLDDSGMTLAVFIK